jgi:hypothetical protein
MKTVQFNHRGTTINKVQFSEVEDILEEKGFNVDNCFNNMADENEFIYVSNGFIFGLNNENNDTEWHHFFKKDADGNFEAFKMSFYNQNIEHA